MIDLVKLHDELLEEIESLRALVKNTERLYEECESAKKALKGNQEKFRLVTETIRDVFWMITPDLSEMLYVSRAYEEVWGRTRESLYREPRSFLDAVHPQDRFYMEERIQDPNKDVEFRIIRPDGSIRWIRTRAFPIYDDTGHLSKITGVASDITELKQKNAQLQEAESLTAIGRMVAFVAHEVRNPLQIIQAGADSLEQAVQQDVRKEILEELRYGVGVLNETVSQLLDYAREPQLEIAPITVREAVESALRNVEPKLRNIQVRTRFEPDHVISVDRDKFAQVLCNVVQNAIEAMPEGGSMSIASEYFEQDGEKRVRITVADSGCGIPAEALARMSDPFFTTKLGGIGLGLSISRKILQAHRGTLDIKSKEKEGTTVVIEIPASEHSGARHRNDNSK